VEKFAIKQKIGLKKREKTEIKNSDNFLSLLVLSDKTEVFGENTESSKLA